MGIVLPLLLVFKINLSATNCQQEVEFGDESEIFQNWHVFVSIFSREIKEKVEKYSQSGYYSFTISYLKIQFLRHDIEFRKTSGRRWSAWLNPK